jgi:ATP-dependent Clp endopeptidase proteolytic subunit ClpP
MKPFYEIKAAAKDRAELWIYEQIGEDWFGDGVTARGLVQELAALKVKNIDLHINSPGGSVFDGQAIYNALKNHPATVTTYIDGIAASIASVIALAGDRVVMSESALFMIHNPYGMAVGDAAALLKMADALEKVGGSIALAYTGKSGKPEPEILDLMSAETWFSADEAKAIGFADEISDRGVRRSQLFTKALIAMHPLHRSLFTVQCNKVKGVTRHRIVGVIVDLTTRNNRHPFIEQPGQ